jgi:hypothetical protein
VGGLVGVVVVVGAADVEVVVAGGGGDVEVVVGGADVEVVVVGGGGDVEVVVEAGEVVPVVEDAPRSAMNATKELGKRPSVICELSPEGSKLK